MSVDVAIVGLGVTAQGVRLGVPERLLRVQALEAALNDAGLKRADVDGYIACHGSIVFEDLRFLGLGPHFAWSLASGGATAISALIGSSLDPGSFSAGPLLAAPSLLAPQPHSETSVSVLHQFLPHPMPQF